MLTLNTNLADRPDSKVERKYLLQFIKELI